MKKAIAIWHISFDVDCPHCKHYFDILDSNELTQSYFNDIDILQREGLNLELTCPKCDKEFYVDEAEY